MRVDEEVLWETIVEAILEGLGFHIAPWEAEEVADKVLLQLDELRLEDRDVDITAEG